MERTSDKLMVGESYEPLKLRLSKEILKQFQHALDCSNPRFQEISFPGILFSFCSITQSPSFILNDGVAAVGAKFDTVFYKILKMDETYLIEWVVVNVYERRSRTYQVCDVKVTDSEGEIVLVRRINNTFIGGEYLERRVSWEKETGYRRAVMVNEFPVQGYEIIGKSKIINQEKLRYYSGGLPGTKWPSRNIHTDREISIRSGVGKPIASGMMFESYLTELLGSFFGEDFFINASTSVVAIDMAGDGDTIIPKMSLKNNFTNNDQTNVEFELWCENQYGNRIMVGSGIKKSRFSI